MSNSYKLSVNNINSFDFTESDLKNLDAVSVGKDKFHVLKSSKSFTAEIVAADFLSKKYTVKINNNTYEVAISNDFRYFNSGLGKLSAVEPKLSTL